MPEDLQIDHDPVGGRLVHLLRPHGRALAAVIGLLVLLVVTNLSLPYAIKILIDDVFPHSDGTGGHWGWLWVILPIMGMIYVVRNALFYPSRMIAVGISEDVCFSLRQSLYDHLQQLNLRFYRSHQAGKVGSRLLDDTFKIQSFINEKLPTLLLNVILCVVVLVILYAVNWKLALASSIVLPLHFGTSWVFRWPIKRQNSEAQESLAAAYGNLIEKFLGMEVVKGFTGEEREHAQFRRAIHASRESQIRTQRYEFIQKVVADLLVGAATVFLFGFGAWEVMRGTMTSGSFIMFFGYITMLYPAVLEVISGAGHWTKTTACVDRVYEMLAEPGSERTSADGADTGEALAIKGQVEFRNVTFAHASGRPVLQHLNLRIRAGERLAITGPSGSGKSTLLNLVPRFLEPTSGQVLVDGKDVQALPVRALRDAIGIAFQEVFLFNASIYENLRYARPEASHDEITDACHLTGAHKFIERRPEGYDTCIGASGNDLSRGERQRISLARALVKNPRILLLDEATASIDNQSSEAIIRSIFEWMVGRTIVVVTHKPELIEMADRVVVIADGRIEFDGPPAELALLNAGIPGEGPSLRHLHSPAPVLRMADTGDEESIAAVPVEEPAVEPEVHVEPGVGEKRVRQGGRGGLVGLLLVPVALGLIFGCAEKEAAVRSIQFEEPKATGALLTQGEDAGELARLAEVWENLKKAPLDTAQAMSEGEAAATEAEAQAAVVESNDGAGPVADESIDPDAQTHAGLVQPGGFRPMTADPSGFPADAGRVIVLPKMSPTEVTELIDGMVLRLQTEKNYAAGMRDWETRLPAPPEGVEGLRLLVRMGEGDRAGIVWLGFHRYLSQPPQLWLWGVMMGGPPGVDGRAAPVEANPDIEMAAAMVEPMLTSLTAMRTATTTADLESRLIQLSYIDPAGALAALRAHGINVVVDANTMPAAIEYAQLPMVVQMPALKPEQIGLIGKETTAAGVFGLSMVPTQATQLSPDTITSQTSQLLVLYHPARPEQMARVESLLRDVIDLPARQIFVEGMVLEISEDGLKDLGIEWEFKEGPIDWMIGSLTAGSLQDTLTFSRVDSRDVPMDWTVRIRALIREGKAEILSRPGVLTLDNRQATIRVGEDIPIATSQEGTASGSNKLSFSFQYLPTGILLNVRPRISADGDQVSMLIDTIVSAVVPGRDLEIRASNGDLLATAPTISTRRVQTYSRINNNTPFIIGGLVSKNLTVTHDKVPLLGNLPIVGAAFRATTTRTSKREVIIVLTPYVLHSEGREARSLPKDEDLFDSFGNKLFRDTYRIRAEDVFDLSFLLQNRRIRLARDVSKFLSEVDPVRAARPPFADFKDGRMPGEQILVHRMMYEFVKRLDVPGGALDLMELIGDDRFIFLEGEQTAGYSVQFLDRVLERLGDGVNATSFFTKHAEEALVITFNYDRDSLREGRLGSEPIPEITLVACPDRAMWGRLLWEYNQPGADGRQRYSIVINSALDMIRLRRSMMLKRILVLNGGDVEATMRSFGIGKMMLIPEIKPHQAHLIDAEVARLFYHTEHYYSATIQTIEAALAAMRQEVQMPEVRAMLEGRFGSSALPEQWEGRLDVNSPPTPPER